MSHDSDFVVSPMFVKALCVSVVVHTQEQAHVKRSAGYKQGSAVTLQPAACRSGSRARCCPNRQPGACVLLE